MPKPVKPNATGARQSDPAPTMSADEAMDILSAARQRAITWIMAAESAEAAAQATAQDADAVSAVEGSQSHA